MSGLGWGEASAGQGAFDNIQKLMQTRIQQAQIAEQARANMARERHEANVEAENRRVNNANIGNQEFDNLIVRANALAPDTPIAPPQQAQNTAAGLGGLMRTRPLDSSITTPQMATVPNVPDMNARDAGISPTDTTPGLLRTAPVFAATQQPNAPGQPGDMLSVPTEANRRLEETARVTAADKAIDNAQAAATLAEQTRYHTGMINKPSGQPDARMDRSYQFNSAQLEKAAGPLADKAGRLGLLIDTVNQKTPQADSLIAPELLIIMAGGLGSGLRINEAEIQRVIGGRSKMESLKAALNQWQADPSKALSVTDAQRADIIKLIAVAQDRFSTKVDRINKARQALVNADTPDEHRKIVADLQAELTGGDIGAGSGLPKVGGEFNGGTILSVTPVPDGK